MANRKLQQQIKKLDRDPTLNRLQKMKTIERFNNYKRIGSDSLSEMELQKILEEIGHSSSPQKIRHMIQSEAIDQSYFSQVIGQYKLFTEQNTISLLLNAFQSMRNQDQTEVQISKLSDMLLDNFEIDIKNFISTNKRSISFDEFKALFG